MNASNAKDYLPLVQALAEGRTIQALCANGDWKDHERIDTGCPVNWYRIKPELDQAIAPDEVWGLIHNDGSVLALSSNRLEAAERQSLIRYIRADLAGEAP